MIKILLGGSPCTYWSIAQKNNRETEPSGLGWELFKNDRHAWTIYGINLGVSKDFARLKKMLSQTLKAGNDKDGYLVLDNWKFYVYNGLERFRLMGFTDSDFEKAQAVNGNSQLYKQAGNSIVVQVLEAIFKQLL